MALNTAIRSEQIQEATISGGHLNTLEAPVDGQVLSYNNDDSVFEWAYIPKLAVNEVPSGSVNGSNTEFILSYTPSEGSEKVYLNGLLQEPGAGKDYIIENNKITFVSAPVSGDILLATYLIQEGAVPYTAVPYGYLMAGENTGGGLEKDVNRIAFPFDFGTAAQVGNLERSRKAISGCNSSQYGFALGQTNENTGFTWIDRITFPFDSGLGSTVGNLSSSVKTGGAYNCSTYGYSVGGRWSGNRIDRITFPFDSGTASNVGSISFEQSYLYGGINSSLHGFTCGGHCAQYNGAISHVNRVTFPFDFGSAAHVGYLSARKLNISMHNSSLYGYVCGGQYSLYVSSVHRLAFPFDTGIASQTGSLTENNGYAAPCNSTNYGYAVGGYGGPLYGESIKTSIQRLAFPFDSGTASHVGNLSASRTKATGVDGTDFVSMFI